VTDRPRPSEPRLTPLSDDEVDDEQRAVLEPLVAFRGTALNIFRTLVRHPRLTRKWLGFGTQVLINSSLPPRERELVILRTAWNCQAVYEFGHHVEIGLEIGLTDDDVEAIPDGPEADRWSERERVLLRATDELHVDQCISDATWPALSAELSEHQLLDLIFLVGQYHLVSMALNSLGVPREEGVPGFPR
jgi:alkylhydroperoxidase family enzyme